MTTFHQITLVCPHCGIKMSDYEMMSYTVHRTTVYSDGLTVTEPWRSNDNAIALCPACQKVFWRDDCVLEEDEKPEEDLPFTGDVHDLPFALSDTSKEELIQFYMDLLKDGFANTTDKKVYLRLRIWWGINDFIRYRKPIWNLLPQFTNLKRAKLLLASRRKSHLIFTEFKPLFRENLEKLIAIFNPEHKGEQIMLAEMYRELGEMGKAREALKSVETKKCRKISQAIARKKRQVIKL
ncbi:MAG: hypothetical protein L3J31_09020 [Bacteroidales bacterium]|nr:hypothetical protein [Bacteroidales bacterium]